MIYAANVYRAIGEARGHSMRGTFVSLLVTALALLTLRADASAQNYPDRSVRIVIAFAAHASRGTTTW